MAEDDRRSRARDRGGDQELHLRRCAPVRAPGPRWRAFRTRLLGLSWPRCWPPEVDVRPSAGDRPGARGPASQDQKAVRFSTCAAPSINAATIPCSHRGVIWTAATGGLLGAIAERAKSHLLIGLGMAAASRGKAVRYVTCAAWSTDWSRRPTSAGLSRLVAAMGDLDLLCLDELGYVQLDARGAELMFQILTESTRRRRRWRTASNLPFSELGTGHAVSRAGGGRC